jgi:hypothetical protein
LSSLVFSCLVLSCVVLYSPLLVFVTKRHDTWSHVMTFCVRLQYGTVTCSFYPRAICRGRLSFERFYRRTICRRLSFENKPSGYVLWYGRIVSSSFVFPRVVMLCLHSRCQRSYTSGFR